MRLLTAQLKDEEVAAAARALVVGGEQLTAEVVEWWQRCAPGVRIFNEYGPTETVVGCTVYELKQGDGQASAIPIGRPIANTQVYLLDSHGQVVPIGALGELYVGGAGVARGYLNRETLTAERFVADPFSPEAGARLYRTGDLARYLPTGELEYAGRADNQVKLRGYRVELGEVEAAVSRHPSVQACAAVVRGAGGHEQLVAYAVGRGGAVVEWVELREHLRGQLPEYMVPSRVMWIEALPLTHNGKVDVKALPEIEAVAEVETYVAPRTPTEEELCGIWAEVLHVERVGAEDSFFELGGHSLLATQLLSRVRDVFGVEVSLKGLFEQPTVAALAVILEESILAEIENMTEADVAQLL
jgi:acyl-coenzyme A synthetase/AMP-(fatty) acid ligase/acyl carrier protein